jgi:hypothetical protein
MQKTLLRWWSGLLSALLLTTAALQAEARPADCRLVIDQKTLMDGPCEFDAGSDGSFRMEDDGHVALVMVTQPGRGEGQWTQKPEVRSSYKEVKGLRRQGACWTSGNNSFCAWAVGQRPATRPAAAANAGVARAATTSTSSASSSLKFTAPQAVRTVNVPGGSQEIKCTYYDDLMVRERLDGPTSEDADLIRPATGALCGAGPLPQAQAISTSSLSLDGRVSKFLVFSEMDSHGVTHFRIIDSASRQTVLDDAAVGEQVLSALETRPDGSLHVRYTRGVVAPCSLLENTPRCWAELVAAGKIPRAMSANAPSPQLCAAPYARSPMGPSPRDNNSIVTYDVVMSIAAAGGVTVESRGRLGCRPHP